MNDLAPPALAPVTVDQWAEAIIGCWRVGVRAIIETGQVIAQAKKALPYGEFTAMVETKLPFKRRKAQMLMEIAADPRLLDAHVLAHLPPMWTVLHPITKLDDPTLYACIEDGTIHPDMVGREISAKAKQQRRAKREAELGAKQCALPLEKFGVIVADPPWRFEPRSRETGMDRAAENHYPTAITEQITSLGVVSLAAADCVLFLWATVPMLPHALTVMEAWGFDYKSHCIWAKTTKEGNLALGTGYWFRNCHELLLVGVRGNIPAPAPGTQYASVIDQFVHEHSAKPECFLEMIEQMFPTLPKIELNRRGPPRKNWSAWGNESQQEDVA
jgi:N6-adenosine-specific RNA methylase IME4